MSRGHDKKRGQAICQMKFQEIIKNLSKNTLKVLLQAILSECKLVKAYSDEYAINKINGMLCACYMLDMLLEPIIIITIDDVIELRTILQFYLNIYYQQQGIKKNFE